MRHQTLIAGLLLATVAIAPRAAADPSPEARATAEAIYEESARLAKENRWAEAAQKLEASNQLDPAIGTYSRLGSCYEHLGRFAPSLPKMTSSASSRPSRGSSSPLPR